MLAEEAIYRLYFDGDAAHDFDHVRRVTRLALWIADEEGADREVVQAAALLHDVPAAVEGRDGHHLAAAVFAQGFLAEQGMAAEQVENVVHCIRSHRFRDQSIQPQTLEARCLYDADKLDSIGAIGIARAFAYAGGHSCRLWHQPQTEVPPTAAVPEGADYTPVHEFVYKLRCLLPTLYTDAARRLGEDRHRFMESFFRRLDAEMTGRA